MKIKNFESENKSIRGYLTQDARTGEDLYALIPVYPPFIKNYNYEVLSDLDRLLNDFFDKNPEAPVALHKDLIPDTWSNFYNTAYYAQKEASSIAKDLNFRTNQTINKEQFEKTRAERNNKIIEYAEEELNEVHREFEQSRKKIESELSKEYRFFKKKEDFESLKNREFSEIEERQKKWENVIKKEINFRKKDTIYHQMIRNGETDGKSIMQYNKITNEMEKLNDEKELNQKNLNILKSSVKSQYKINDKDLQYLIDKHDPSKTPKKESLIDKIQNLNRKWKTKNMSSNLTPTIKTIIRWQDEIDQYDQKLSELEKEKTPLSKDASVIAYNSKLEEIENTDKFRNAEKNRREQNQDKNKSIYD